MKLLLYKGTRKGFAGIGNWAVRKRTKSIYSHCEIMFEEGDGDLTAAFMPDQDLNPNQKGERWCFSATASDRMPDWGNGRNRRAGKLGGTRFKRINPYDGHWDVVDVPYADPAEVAKFCRKEEGKAYDWRHIFSFFSVILVGFLINLWMTQGLDHWTCSEICAEALGYKLSEIYDPKNLGAVAATVLMFWKKATGDPAA